VKISFRDRTDGDRCVTRELNFYVCSSYLFMNVYLPLPHMYLITVKLH